MNNIVKLGMVEARKRFTHLPEDMHGNRVVEVTRRGKPVMIILPYDLYDSLIETLEILEDAEFISALHKGIEDVKLGKITDLEESRKRLGL